MDWHASFHSTLEIELLVRPKIAIPAKAHYINIRPHIRDSQILSVMGEAQGVDRMTVDNVRNAREK
jgi:hypothetical protein